ncbi:MAG: GIY-YIG nuclease family protein [Candidatus Taylorbacteria bacterium]
MYYIYILKCVDDTLYVGSTNDLEGRIYRHNNSKSGAHYTKIRRPVTLVYNEKFDTKSEALKREIEIKSWKRDKKLDLINEKG